MASRNLITQSPSSSSNPQVRPSSEPLTILEEGERTSCPTPKLSGKFYPTLTSIIGNHTR
ncbi:MAG: hypothetical protein VKL39_00260 [Leptolyngbyaceae bacterium]|nr:hypothetical protein [Leptolyngbyaceae bacterium]